MHSPTYQLLPKILSYSINYSLWWMNIRSSSKIVYFSILYKFYSFFYSIKLKFSVYCHLVFWSLWTSTALYGSSLEVQCDVDDHTRQLLLHEPQHHQDCLLVMAAHIIFLSVKCWFPSGSLGANTAGATGCTFCASASLFANQLQGCNMSAPIWRWSRGEIPPPSKWFQWIAQRKRIDPSLNWHWAPSSISPPDIDIFLFNARLQNSM